ncbi:MAG: DNA alkylation repair protein [Chloroflexi bacterium]|nr:DNA alkylation repair protein [Chloroflexota bacterium]
MDWRSRVAELKSWALSERWEAREGGAFGLRDELEADFDRAFPVVRSWIANSHPYLRRAGVVVCRMRRGRCTPRQVALLLEAMEPALLERERYVRVNVGPFALASLAHVQPDVALPRIAQWAHREEEVVRWNVAMAFSQALGRRYPDVGLAILRLLATDPRRFVWRAVASSLRNIGRTYPRRVVPLLEDWLADDTRRAPAEVALAHIYK